MTLQTRHPTRLGMASLALLLTAGSAFAEHHLIPNSQRYAERSPSAATGRAGNATVAIQTMLGKDGQTALDVTTNGQLSKLQLKAFDLQENQAWVKNISGLTGSRYQTMLSGF